MTRLIAWVKSNPVIVVSILLVLVSLGGLVIIHFKGSSLVTRMDEAGTLTGKIAALTRTSVTIPPETPDQPPRRLSITINRAAIDQLDQAYREMHNEYTSISSWITQINQHNHGLMYQNILPNPADQAVRIDVKQRFRGLLLSLLGKPTPQNPFGVLDAGQPPDPAEIAATLEAVEKDYLTSQFFPPKTLSTLTDAEKTRLFDYKRRKLLDQLEEQAQAIHIYADNRLGPGFPFDASAIRGPDSPEAATDEEIWEGHMSLWIQQDIVQAIAQTNHVDNPDANVIDAPIKRLLSIQIVPGYIGIDPAKGQPAPTPDKIPDDFSHSPSGRVSNSYYDVRHVKVAVIIDSQQLPVFFAALSKVNFMTVLLTQIKQVDAYEALRDGFVYGAGDAVQADLLIETIWFRDWTSRLMPANIKAKLGIAPSSEPNNSH